MNHYNDKGATTPKNILGNKKKGNKEECPWIDKATSFFFFFKSSIYYMGCKGRLW